LPLIAGRRFFPRLAKVFDGSTKTFLERDFGPIAEAVLRPGDVRQAVLHVSRPGFDGVDSILVTVG
jgi:hypothetical protein